MAAANVKPLHRLIVPPTKETNVKQDFFGFPFITVVFLLHRVSGVLAPGDLFWGVMHCCHFS